MSTQQEIPYYVTIEVANKQCKGLRMLENLGITQYTLSDIRGLPGGSTRHLIRVPPKKIKEIPENTMRIHRSEFSG
jgi:hypothetical protein